MTMGVKADRQQSFHGARCLPRPTYKHDLAGLCNACNFYVDDVVV